MKARHALQLIGLSAIWGASFPMLKVVAPEMGFHVVATLRVVIATVTLALIMRATGERWPTREWPGLVLLGLISVGVPYLTFAYGAFKGPAGYMALLNPSAVLFAMLSSVWFGEDRLTPGKFVGFVLGVVGLTMVVHLGPMEPNLDLLLGSAAVVLGTFCYGTATPYQKRFTQRLGPLGVAGPIHLAASVVLLPFGAAHVAEARFTPLGIVLVVALGVLPSALAYWVHLRIMRHVTPVAAVTPIFLIPVFGVTWSHLFLGEPMGLGTLLGGAVVLLAAALVTGFTPWRRSRPPGGSPSA